jgi:short-subunit dehydrogenase
MPKAVIVGASSGIGEELARVMAADGWELGIAARRAERLSALADSLEGTVEIATLDVSVPEEAMKTLALLLEKLDPVDVVVVNAGIGIPNYKLKWEPEASTIEVNVTGFAAMTNTAVHYFEKLGRGHLVGISSVAALRGGYGAPAYAASKAFVSNYMEGVRVQAFKRKLNLTVTDVRPGYVHTPMTEGQKGMFWVADAKLAARQIYGAIKRRRKRVYVTRRWSLVAAVMRMVPDSLYRKF